VGRKGSWLLAPPSCQDPDAAASQADASRGNDGDVADGAESDDEALLLEKPELLVATPIDPLFLILPALAADMQTKTGGESRGESGKFISLPASEYLDRLSEQSPHFAQVLLDSRTAAQSRSGQQQQSLDSLFESRIRSVCNMISIGGDEEDESAEMLYRLSIPELLLALVAKARRVMEGDGTGAVWPRSMEAKFITEALAVPLRSVKREESSVSLAQEAEEQAGATSDGGVGSEGQQELSANPASTETSSLQDSQATSVPLLSTSASTASTTLTSQSSATSTTTSPSFGLQTESNSTTTVSGPSQQITHLLRLRTVLNYLLQSYVPAHLHIRLQDLMASPESPIDLTPLTTHLAHLASLRAEAQIMRSLSENITRKRPFDDAEGEAGEKAEARKKFKEAEEAAKKNRSRGVKALQKVDRSGMTSLKSFFGVKSSAKGKG